MNLRPEKRVSNRSEIARRILEEYKRSHPYYSTLQIARKWGIPQSTLSRIENGTTNPSMELLLKLIVESGNGEDLFQYLRESDPELADAFINANPHNFRTQFLNHLCMDYFGDENYDWLLHRVYTRRGMTRDEVSLRFGHYGLSRLEELKQVGLLKEDSDGQITGVQERFKLPLNLTYKMVLNSIKRDYKPNEAGAKNNWISFQTESIKKEKLEEYKELLRKQFVERQNFLNEPDNFGDCAIFTSSVYSTFDEMPQESLMTENLTIY